MKGRQSIGYIVQLLIEKLSKKKTSKTERRRRVIKIKNHSQNLSIGNYYSYDLRHNFPFIILISKYKINTFLCTSKSSNVFLGKLLSLISPSNHMVLSAIHDKFDE